MATTVQASPTIYTHILDMRRGADWFFWIAAFAVVNSLLVTFSGTQDSLFGLGATRWVDAAMRENALAPVNTIGLAFNLAIAGIFAAFGYYAREGRDRVFMLGIFLYVVDAMIVLGFKDFFAFGFHIVALFFLFKGLWASRRRFDPSV